MLHINRTLVDCRVYPAAKGCELDWVKVNGSLCVHTMNSHCDSMTPWYVLMDNNSALWCRDRIYNRIEYI